MCEFANIWCANCGTRLGERENRNQTIICQECNAIVRSIRNCPLCNRDLIQPDEGFEVQTKNTTNFVLEIYSIICPECGNIRFDSTLAIRFLQENGNILAQNRTRILDFMIQNGTRTLTTRQNVDNTWNIDAILNL